MKKISLAILTLLVVFTACKKVPEVNKEYVDVERDLITVGATTATIQCDYDYIATLKKAYLYYCEGEDEIDMSAVEMRVVQNTLYADLDGLRENTTYCYYYEFYNGFNSMRSAVKTFKTENGSGGGGGGNSHEGILPGLFSVSSDKKVNFSQGNLQYQASTGIWRFAEHQWDFVGSEVVYQGEPGGNVNGSSNHLISEFYDGWIDLFAWGTSGYNHGAACYQPWSTSSNGSDYYAYGSPSYNLYDNTGQADWGYNPIINGGNIENFWRTLKQEEMSYVFYRRGVEVSFVRAVVNGVKGVVLLPDDWDASYYSFSNPNVGNNPYSDNVISSMVWSDVLESQGAVFFPAAGLRRGLGIALVNSWGQYALSTAYDENQIYRFGFDEEITVPADVGSSWRDICFSVRLAHDATFQPSIQTPTVITSDVSNVTSSSAVCGGEITHDGGAEVAERGICWSINANPTLNDSHVAAGTGTGAFTALMNGLEANTTYHVRAYATNEAGTAYGLDREFVTALGGSNGVPEGAINGLFSVSPTKKVFFSQGNLQYQASTNTWRFAEHQWDFVGSEVVFSGDPGSGGNVTGSSNHLISEVYDGWIDLFGWGTSGYNHGAVCYQPWSTSPYWEDYYAYGSPSHNLYNNTGQADWGFNAISNGGNQQSQWRTLTTEEWVYVFDIRHTSSGIRYAKANVNNVNGVVIVPDNWNTSTFMLHNTNQNDADYESNIINAAQWNTIQAAGAVFLPAAGHRPGSNAVWYAGIWGYYWAASYYDNEYAYGVFFVDNHWDPENHLFSEYRFLRDTAHSVRLVQDAN